MERQIHDEDMAEGREGEKRDKRWGLHKSTAVSQRGSTEGRRMMDDSWYGN